MALTVLTNLPCSVFSTILSFIASLGLLKSTGAGTNLLTSNLSALPFSNCLDHLVHFKIYQYLIHRLTLK